MPKHAPLIQPNYAAFVLEDRPCTRNIPEDIAFATVIALAQKTRIPTRENRFAVGKNDILLHR